MLWLLATIFEICLVCIVCSLTCLNNVSKDIKGKTLCYVFLFPTCTVGKHPAITAAGWLSSSTNRESSSSVVLLKMLKYYLSCLHNTGFGAFPRKIDAYVINYLDSFKKILKWVGELSAEFWKLYGVREGTNYHNTADSSFYIHRLGSSPNYINLNEF